MPKYFLPEILLKFAISILFPGLQFVPFGLPNPEIGQESGVNLYKKLTDPRAHHQLSLGIRQKFLLFAHHRFFISRFLGNYRISTNAQYHHPPTVQTIFVLQHVSKNFFNPVEPNYPFESGHPPVSLNKCCELLSIITELLERTSDFGNLESIDILRLLHKIAKIAD
jgi:hypothetical protein